MKINFIKCHGSGNDFILVDCMSDKLYLDEFDYSNITKIVCDRNGSIGADGTLFLLPSEIADVRMRIFNSDGSEPEMCGNGIRCIARKANELLEEDEFSIETMKTILKVKKEEDMFKGIYSFSVVLDDVNINYNKSFSVFNEYIEGLSDIIKFTTINIGNPHIVANVEDLDVSVLEKIGVKANSLTEVFPNGVNVSFYKSIGRQAIYVATYERGVGMTHSCGTAMSSTSIASSLLGLTSFNKWVTIYNKGGMVKCFPKKDGSDISVKLLGNATFVYASNFVYDRSYNKVSSFIQGDVDLDEIMSYGKLQNFSEEYLKMKL